jgi:threonine aldolase
MLAAAAMYALDHNIARLRDDHDRARQLGSVIERIPGLTLDAPVQTNIVVFRVDPGAWTVEALLAELRKRDVLAVAFGAGRVRMVTHLDVTAADVERAGEALLAIGAR